MFGISELFLTAGLNLQSLTSIFAAGTPIFKGGYILLYGGTPTFWQRGPGTLVSKIRVRALNLSETHP